MNKDCDTACCAGIMYGGTKTINCDQVCWLLDIFDRYLPYDKYPRISRQREMKKYGMLYEVIEAAGLSFLDGDAILNATPKDVRNFLMYDDKGELPE